MKALVLVLSCLERPYPDLARAQKRTWAARDVAGIDVLFYAGGSPETERRGRDLQLDVADGYWEIGRKTLAGFRYVLEHHDFDLVFRTNSSSYVDLPNLSAWIAANAQPTGFYAGSGEVSYASGSGYFLSRDLVELVLQAADEWDHSLHDDIALGSILAARGVPLVSTPRVILEDRWNPRTIDVAQFHFRCKTATPYRRGDVDLLLKVDEAFLRTRDELHVPWYTPVRRLKMLVRRGQRALGLR